MLLHAHIRTMETAPAAMLLCNHASQSTVLRKLEQSRHHQVYHVQALIPQFLFSIQVADIAIYSRWPVACGLQHDGLCADWLLP